MADKDFKISADGVLERYRGKGGDVVIPEGVRFLRSGRIKGTCDVFPPDVAITSIHLPKSFIGVRTITPEVLPFGLKVSSQHYEESIDWRGYQFKAKRPLDIYGFMMHLAIPSLERYEVAEGNPIYKASNGILYSSDHSIVVSIPAKCTSPVEAESTRLIQPRAIESYSSDIVNFTDTSPVFHYDLYDNYDHINGKILKIRAVNAQDHDVDRFIYFVGGVPNVVIIAPHCDLETSHSLLGICASFGYLYEPDLYDAEHAQRCTKRLLEDEELAYACAVRNQLDPVVAFYESTWSRQFLSQINMSTRGGCNRYLEHAVMYGTTDDMQLALDTARENETFSMHSLMLACRYGGVEKLKCLLDSPVYTEQIMYVGASRVSIKDFIASQEFLWIISVHGYTYVVGIRGYALSSDHEIRNLKCLSEEERLKCVKLLLERDLIEPKVKNYLCYLSFIAGDIKIGEYLHKQGAKIETFTRINCDNIPMFKAEEYLRQGLMWCPEGAIALAKYAQLDGAPLVLNKTIIGYAFSSHPHLISDILQYAQIVPAVARELIYNAIEEKNTEVMAAFISAGIPKTKRTTDNYLQYALEQNASEIVALLMEYKNQTFNKQKASSKAKAASTATAKSATKAKSAAKATNRKTAADAAAKSGAVAKRGALSKSEDGAADAVDAAEAKVTKRVVKRSSLRL